MKAWEGLVRDSSTRPLSVDQVANGVRDLARLRRAYWGFSAATHPALAWVQTWAPTEGFHSALRKRVPPGMERAGARLPAEVARQAADEIVDVWVRYVALLGHDPTLLHANAHIGNTYLLPNDDAGFLDWQVVRRGHWSQDVGYFLQGALVEADRRAAERDLVAAYSKELGRGMSAADAWQWYRSSASNIGRALDTAIPGAALTGLGHEQAARLVTRLAGEHLDVIAASPLTRAQQRCRRLPCQ
ncbi:MAG TPA: histidine phosphatase family protein [Trebonia sp.]|nr:histidine phosphatase family protein [Trebonia sp.]